MDNKTIIDFNRIAKEARAEFNLFVGKLYDIDDSLDWFVSSPLSRNIFISPLFHYYCSIILIIELMKGGAKEAVILTDSKSFFQMMGGYLKGNSIKILCKVSIKDRIKKVFKPYCCFFSTIFNSLLIFCLFKISKREKRLIPSSPLTLIDTFILFDYIDNDRYYPRMTDSLSDYEKKTVFFVPTLVGIGLKNALTTVKRLRNSTRQFLLKEDYLKIGDYFYALMYFFRVKRLAAKLPSIKLFDIDVSPVLREELRQVIDFKASFLALLNCRFVSRLKESGADIKLFIDWFENQAIDKGINMGFRKFFPNAKTKGYIGGYASDYFMSLYPIKEEAERFIIPDEISVIGEKARSLMFKYYPGLKVSLAPAFRFQHLWGQKEEGLKADPYTILIALPMILNDAVMVLNTLIETVQSLDAKVNILIKIHPTTALERIKNMTGRKIPEAFEFVRGTFNECIRKADLLLSTSSSVCLESLAEGIPVIIIGSNTGLTHNPIPESIDSDIWRVCYTPNEIAEAVSFYRNFSQEKINEKKEEGRKIRADYFNQITIDGVRGFLEIED